MPKLNHFRKKESADPLDQIDAPNLRAAVQATVRAVEGFVMFSCIAMGLIQMIALQYSSTLNLQSFRYLRTRSGPVASEGTTMCFLRRYFFRFMALCPDSTISRIILSKSDSSGLHLAA